MIHSGTKQPGLSCPSNSAFIEAEKTLVDEKYHKTLEWCRSMARDQGIDAALQEYCADVLLIPCSSGNTSTRYFSYILTYLDPFHTARGWTYPCMTGRSFLVTQ